MGVASKRTPCLYMGGLILLSLFFRRCRSCFLRVKVKDAPRYRGVLNPNSAVQMSEGRTWSSEDTQPYSFKVFSTLRLLLDCPNYLRTAPMYVADLEAECIVFATEGLLL